MQQVQFSARRATASSEDYRWMLVDDFVAFFNEHREKFFNPSSDMCADESMSRWYGLDWINIGLPMYVALDRKPEHGCKIQNLCDGQSGIMLRLLLVKSGTLCSGEEAIRWGPWQMTMTS